MPPRQSERNKPSTSRPIYAGDSNTDADGDPDKSAISSGGRALPVAKRRGKLQQMLDMPLDIIVEICSHLHPRDLLHLARSSKVLRKFFMSRNSTLAWKAARLTLIDPLLPPCPNDLSEPAYANLMFDTHCHSCLKKNSQDIYWRCRVRLCKSCYGAQRLERGRWSQWSTVVDVDVEKLIYPRQIDDIMPSLISNGPFYRPHLHHFVSSLKSTRPHDLEKFLKAREELVAYVEKDVRCLSQYLLFIKNTRSSELHRVRRARKDSIIEKLKEEGFQEEIDFMLESWSSHRGFVRLPEVSKAQLLTPRVWNNIREAVIKFMKVVRKDREYRQVETILWPRIRILNKSIEEILRPLYPYQISTLTATLCIPELYYRLNPAVAEFDAEDFQHFLQEFLPRYLEQHAKDAKEEFTKKTRKRLGLKESEDPFDLALTTLFICPHCSAGLTSTHAPFHQCHFHKIRKPEWMSQHYYDLCSSINTGLEGKRTWSPCILSDKGTERTEMVIKACGFDPRTATAAELDQADLRLQCTTSNERITLIMGWRTAISCCCGTSPSFALATGQQAAAVKPLEAQTLQDALNKQEQQHILRCSHCSDTLQRDKALIKKHIIGSHSINEPTEADWVDMSKTGPYVPDPIYVVSHPGGEVTAHLKRPL
ncbi:hypothetical protein BDY19DRAFT_611129 [Irpex rosettiformis]|uniref:Uncharacterized protein n=1 Tax=Irpex rosettiformis TaxID=378272 RepID=A0ACB8TPJ7_9APHY|nr:hypothetical protein BDY19DRAFT_611129 [Irpex rosettiformis]